MEKNLLVILSLILLWSCKQSTSDVPGKLEGNVKHVSPDLTDFVSLDRAYIPVLFFTSVENLVASKASYNELEKQWEAFRSVSNQVFDDEEWKGELQEIEGHIAAAGSIIAQGEHLKEAHEALEHVREILLKTRQRNDIDYFVDHLTAFHEPMEQIVLTARQTPPNQWTDETTSKLKSVIPDAEALWQVVLEASFDPDVYGFNDQRQQKMKQHLAAETQAIDTLKLSLEEQTPIPQLRKNAMGIKPHFAGLFKLFGNLEDYEELE